jgi:hypothetical protein
MYCICRCCSAHNTVRINHVEENLHCSLLTIYSVATDLAGSVAMAVTDFSFAIRFDGQTS